MGPNNLLYNELQGFNHLQEVYGGLAVLVYHSISQFSVQNFDFGSFSTVSLIHLDPQH